MSNPFEITVDEIFHYTQRLDDEAALITAARRYRYNSSGGTKEHGKHSTGLTLLFAHGTGFHKEQWEVTLHVIFNHYAAYKPQAIREAWSLDWQDHGQSAVLNEANFEARGSKGVFEALYELARSIASFLESGHLDAHNLVLIGHSLGAAAILLATKHFLRHSPACSLVLVDPAMVTQDLWDGNIDNCQDVFKFHMQAARSRRDHWPSKDAAYAWLKKRAPWKNWDHRVLQLFVDHGLHQGASGVSLKCKREYEALHYQPSEVLAEAPRIITQICGTTPIHLIWGEVPDMVPLRVRKSLSDPSNGFKVASVKLVEGAGHLVLAEQPERLASAICEILNALPPTLGSKL